MHAPARRRRGQQLSKRATDELLALERTLFELAAAGDVEYLAAALALALTRLDRHFTKPYRFVLRRWGHAA